MEHFPVSYFDCDDTEPIELKCFPQHLLSKILSKMTYRDAAVFEQCSRFTRNVCKNRVFPLELTVAVIHFGRHMRPDNSDISVTVNSERHRIYTCPFEYCKDKNVRLITAELSLSGVYDDERLHRVLKIVKENGIKARLIHFDFSESIPTFRVKLFNELIEVCEAESLGCRHGIADKYLRNNIVHDLKSICLEFGPSEDSFLSFNATKIQINRTDIEPLGINTFFGQWNYGQRTIDRLKMYCDFNIYSEKANVFLGLMADEFDTDHPDFNNFPPMKAEWVQPMKTTNGTLGLFKISGGRYDFLYVITYNRLIDVFKNVTECSKAIVSHLQQAGTVCEFCGCLDGNCIRLY